MALTVRGQFSDFFLETMKPMLERVIYASYKRRPAEWPKIFDQDSTQASIYQTTTHSGVGLPTQINEGQPVNFDSPVQGFDKTFKPVRFGLGIQVSQDLVEDDTKLRLAPKRARMLANSINEAQEIQMASIFNNGFSATGPDGVALFSASHPLVKAGGVQSNLLSAAADLDNTSLELALIDYEGTVDQDGKLIRLPLPKVVVARQNRFVIAEIIESKDRSDTPNRATNAFAYTEGGIPGWMVWHYLTDPDAWFLCAQPEDTQLLVIWRRKPYTHSWFDEDTETGKTAMRYKLDYGWGDFYGVYGTPGA